MSTFLHMLSVPAFVLTAALVFSAIHIYRARKKGADKVGTYIIPIWLTGGGLFYNLAILWGSHMVTGKTQYSMLYTLDASAEWTSKLAFIFFVYVTALGTIITSYVIYTVALKLMKVLGGAYE